MNLRTDNLSFRYKTQPVLEEIQLELHSGEFLFLLGASGAGKTTLLKLLAGLIQPTEGRVLLDGQEIGSLPARMRATRVGLMLQDAVPPFDYTAEEFVLFGRTARLPRFSAPSAQDWKAVHDALAAVKMEWGAKRKVDAFSGGEFQRLRLASLLALDSEVLLLDEPFSSQDPAQTDSILRLLQALARQGKIVLLTTHLLSAAEKYATRVLLMADHRIFADGTPKELLTPQNYQKLYGIW